MSNYCGYEMKVVGTKENRDKWFKKMQDYNESNHFYRMFVPIERTDDKNSSIFVGDCAWSIESCCRASGYSDGVDLLAVNTKDLNLKVEIWSQEPGLCFQEHYIYDNGECLADECTEWVEYFYDESECESFEEWKEEYDVPDDVTVDEVDDCGYIYRGGFDDYLEWSI